MDLKGRHEKARERLLAKLAAGPISDVKAALSPIERSELREAEKAGQIVWDSAGKCWHAGHAAIGRPQRGERR